MKRVIKHSTTSLVYCGVSIDDAAKITFNWGADSPNDIMSLCSSGLKETSIEGVSVFHGYQFKSNVPRSHRRRVVQVLKNLGNDNASLHEDILDFIENAVFRLDETCGLSNFDVCVHVQPSRYPALVSEIGRVLVDNCSGLHVDFETIKRMMHEVKFDKQAAYQLLRDNNCSSEYAAKVVEQTEAKFRDAKAQNQLFTMKSMRPRTLRAAISDFLKFKNEEDKLVYETLQGSNVLIYDDFQTSGTTVRELIRYLKSINPNNTLTAFALVKL